MSKPDSSRRHPYWLWKTKRLFPHPLFAGFISLALLVVGLLFAGVAINVDGCWPMAIPSVLFFAGCFATAAAAITPSDTEPPTVTTDVQTEKPTLAIFVLLIGVYSWLLVSHLASYFMLILAWFMMLKGTDPRWPSRIGSGSTPDVFAPPE